MSFKLDRHTTSACLNRSFVRDNTAFNCKLKPQRTIYTATLPPEQPISKQTQDDYTQAKYYLGGAALMFGSAAAISFAGITSPVWVPQLLTVEGAVLLYRAFEKLDYARGFTQR